LLKNLIYKDVGGQGLYERRHWKKGGAQKTMFSCKSSTKLPQKGKFFTVQDEFCRIIAVGG
jgi:hypothetical protein